MAVVDPISRSAVTSRRTIDIAGTPWPLYKLEALALGLLILSVLALVTGSVQIAVLAGAVVATVRWVVGAVRTTRS